MAERQSYGKLSVATARVAQDAPVGRNELPGHPVSGAVGVWGK